MCYHVLSCIIMCYSITILTLYDSKRIEMRICHLPGGHPEDLREVRAGEGEATMKKAAANCWKSVENPCGKPYELMVSIGNIA